MPATCLLTLGLLCLTSGDGKLATSTPGFGSLKTYDTPAYRIAYERSDAHRPRDVSRYEALCGLGDCVRVKVEPTGCSIRFEIVEPSDPEKDWTGTSYTVTAKTRAGLAEALAKAQVPVREGRTDVFRSLQDVVGDRAASCLA
jgi:hypothetical protein